jgi:AcrR family transcriptional regulator
MLPRRPAPPPTSDVPPRPAPPSRRAPSSARPRRQRAPEAADTRTRLLDVTAALLEQLGPTGVDQLTTRAVCDAAGVTAPTLYHHFGDKDGLVRATVARAAEQYLAGKRALRTTEDPVADLRRGWDAWTAFVTAHPALVALALARPDAAPGAAAEADDLLGARVAAVAHAGRLAVDAPTAAATVRAAVEGVKALVRRGEPAARVAATSALLRDAVLGVILPGLLVVALLGGTAADGGAQDVARDTMRGTVRDTAHATPAGLAATGGLILLGAAGAQALHTPAAWPRTAAGFGRRVADQTGFYVVQTGAQRALAARLGWRDDDTPCPRRAVGALASCAVARTFTAVDRSGARRVHLPFVTSVGAATAASVLWRPERESPAKARAFVATRLGVVFAGYAAERLLVEWRRARGRRP